MHNYKERFDKNIQLTVIFSIISVAVSILAFIVKQQFVQILPILFLCFAVYPYLGTKSIYQAHQKDLVDKEKSYKIANYSFYVALALTFIYATINIISNFI